MLAGLIALAGGAGAVCRYLLDGAIQERWRGPFPMGTFLVNASGAFLLGVLVGLTSSRSSVRVVLGIGFDGAFTTFSTLAYETSALLRDGARRYALGNLLGTTAVAIALAALGLALGRAL